tara:strand:+ start:712 stop:1095 length:384 start_codon:yes stop_codon:yes gene_type:complete
MAIHLKKGKNMDPNIRSNLQISAFYQFQIIIFITTLTQLTTMLAIVFGDLSDKENVVAATVVIMTLLGAFGIIRTMTNLKFAIGEMDDKTANTAYGKEIQSIPINVLRFVFAGFFVIIAIFQLTAIY